MDYIFMMIWIINFTKTCIFLQQITYNMDTMQVRRGCESRDGATVCSTTNMLIAGGGHYASNMCEWCCMETLCKEGISTSFAARCNSIYVKGGVDGLMVCKAWICYVGLGVLWLIYTLGIEG